MVCHLVQLSPVRLVGAAQPRPYLRRWVIQVNNRAGDSEFAIVFECFSRIKNARPN